jgi:general secretion pathway protein A
MYLPFFKLKRNPFAMTPDPSMIYMTESHRDALAGVTYSVLAAKGFVVMIGDAGTGKTTVISRMLRYIPRERAAFSLLLSPTVTADEFLESVLIDFGITDIPSSKVQRLVKLQEFVSEAHTKGTTCVLLVDEAHKLSREVLEEIRLLTNFENAERKLLQIVLAGQTELADVLNRDDLRQLKQRIAVRFTLRPLSAFEVPEYLYFRWAAGGAESVLPFEDQEIQTIAEVSRGIPRIINAICDNALLLAFVDAAPMVTADHVYEAICDLDLGRPDMRPMPAVSQPPAASQPPPLPKLNLPEPALPAHPMSLRTLERYMPPEPKAPLLMRWATKLRLANVEH